MSASESQEKMSPFGLIFSCFWVSSQIKVTLELLGSLEVVVLTIYTFALD